MTRPRPRSRKRLLAAVTTAAALINHPSMAQAGDGFGGYGNGYDERIGPYDANSTAFLDAVAASNATGLFRIPGPDVSKPFPGEPTTGWTLSIAALDLSNPDPLLASAERPDEIEPMIGYSLTIKGSLLPSGIPIPILRHGGHKNPPIMGDVPLDIRPSHPLLHRRWP